MTGEIRDIDINFQQPETKISADLNAESDFYHRTASALDNFATRFMTGAIGEKGIGRSDPDSVLSMGVVSGMEAGQRENQTERGKMTREFLQTSAKRIKNNLKELNIKTTELISSPIPTIGKILNIDSQTAQRMLDMLGIKTQNLSTIPIEAQEQLFARNALATEIMGAMLLATGNSDDKDEHRASVPKVKAPPGARVPQKPMQLMGRRKISIPNRINLEMAEREIKIRGRVFKIRLPKSFGIRTTPREIPDVTFIKPRLERPKIKIPWGKVVVGCVVALGIYWGFYGLGGLGKNIESYLPTATPTMVPPIPTQESFSSELLRITLPNYANGMTSIDFMDVGNGATQNMTANAIDSNHPVDTWMWSRNTSDSLDFYQKILGDKTITLNDVNRFRTNPAEFINWLRMSGKTDQADFYQYRLTGNNGLPPSAKQFEDWVKVRFGK